MIVVIDVSDVARTPALGLRLLNNQVTELLAIRTSDEIAFLSDDLT
jgi:hypothetical protein